MKKGDKVFVEAELISDFYENHPGHDPRIDLRIGSQEVTTWLVNVHQSMEHQLVNSPLMHRLKEAEAIVKDLAEASEWLNLEPLQLDSKEHLKKWEPEPIKIEALLKSDRAEAINELIKEGKAKFPQDYLLKEGNKKMHLNPSATPFPIDEKYKKAIEEQRPIQVDDQVCLKGVVTWVDGNYNVAHLDLGEDNSFSVPVEKLELLRRPERPIKMIMTKGQMKQRFNQWLHNNNNQVMTADDIWALLTDKEG